MTPFNPLTFALTAFGVILTACGFALGILKLAVHLGWVGGDKANTLRALDTTIGGMRTDMDKRFDVLDQRTERIETRIGGQDVTLAVHGEKLTALTQRLDDEFGRRRPAG